MTISGVAQADRGVAIFTRNYRVHLDEAVALSEADPERLITFRARNKWASALASLKGRTPRPLYAAPVGGNGMVEYVAELREVILNPTRGEPDTERLLDLTTESTRDEGLWEKDGTVVRTLYAVSNCRQLATPFPMTDLVKVSNGKPISEDYGYSYTVVYPYAFDGRN